jgi:UDP-glucose 4-epimerase
MERRTTPCRLSPRIAAERRDRLNVFGGDCDSSDRTGMRDCVHVVDSAQGMSPRSSWPLERVWLLQLVP